MYAEASYIICVTASVKQPAVLKRRKLSSRQWQQPKTALGQLGEDQAVYYLLTQKYLIKARNILFKSGEIDIVAYDTRSGELVFVEVKTRSHTHFGPATSSWNWKKRRSCLAAAALYLKNSPSFTDIRFDLITITRSKICHYQNISLDTP